MNHQFEPQQITLRDALGWFKAAALLIRRKPHYFIIPLLPITVYQTAALDYLLIFPLYFLLVFTLQLSFSESADLSAPIEFKRVWQQLRHTLSLNGGLLAGMLILRVLVAALLLMGYTPPLIDQVRISPGPAWVENIHELSSSAMILLIFFQYIHGWFRHTLRQFHAMPADVAKQLSRKASIINFFVIWQVSMGLLLLQLLSFFVPLWAEFVIKAALLLILPPYCYVAYRHVFLGKKENAPVKVVEHEPAAAAHPI